MQHQLLRQLAGERRDLFLVGDPAQAIYGFNGSDPTLLADVDQHLPGVEVIRLPTNHRCTPQIVAAGRHALGGVGHHDDAGRRPRRRHAGGDRGRRRRARRGGPGGTSRPRPRPRRRPRRRRRRAGPHARSSSPASTGPRRRRRAGATRMARARAARWPRRCERRRRCPSAAQLRGWAHDMLEGTPTPYGAVDDAVESPERRVAAAVLEFLRDQPDGNGAALRAWLAATNPFTDADRGGRRRAAHVPRRQGPRVATVVVTGVETGLVPHRTASTAAARAEEARLLHVRVHPGRRPPGDHPRPAPRGLRPQPQPVDRRPRRVVTDTGRAARRRARGARHPRVERRRRSPGPAPRVARRAARAADAAARPALHRRRPGSARPHPAGRRRRAVVVDRARAADARRASSRR